MEFFKKTTCIDFMRLKNLAFILSIALCTLSLISLWQNGLNLGLDFTGGTQIQLHFAKSKDANDVRSTLKSHHFKGASAQSYGSTQDILIQIPPSHDHQKINDLKTQLQQLFKDAHIQRIEYIGPQVGQELVHNGLLAILLSMLITMVYIAFRFELRFAISAAISLIHDPILTLGIFAFTGLEFNLIALGALLTVLGYSLNDTIVVYDRIRENFRLNRKDDTKDVVNASINQTLSRTIMTSGLTLLVVLSLCFLGGENLHGFSIALIIGIVVGTYSSIYIAGSLAVVMGLNRHALIPKNKAPIDDLP